LFVKLLKETQFSFEKIKWIDIPLQETWPHHFSYAKNESISLKEALAVIDISDLFNLPVFDEATVQLKLFQSFLLESIPSNDFDSWTILG
jgi:hypothetical protein